MAEDQKILNDFDIYNEAGEKNIAVAKTFTVGVEDGNLDLNFVAEIDNAKISAIEITPIEIPKTTTGEFYLESEIKSSIWDDYSSLSTTTFTSDEWGNLTQETDDYDSDGVADFITFIKLDSQVWFLIEKLIFEKS